LAVIERRTITLAEIRQSPHLTAALSAAAGAAVEATAAICGFEGKLNPNTPREWLDCLYDEFPDATPDHIATFLARVKRGHYELYGNLRLPDLCRWFREFMTDYRAEHERTRNALDHARITAELEARKRWENENPELAKQREAAIQATISAFLAGRERPGGETVGTP
jgi:hypothetical protein